MRLYYRARNVALGIMLAPTDGKVLAASSVDTKICGDNCDIATEVVEIKKNIERYDGKIIPAKISQTADGMFYKLEEKVFSSETNDAIDMAQLSCRSEQRRISRVWRCRSAMRK